MLAAKEEDRDSHCSMCNNAGWIFDWRPNKPGPLMLELIPCIHPECTHSGRPIQNICFKGIEFTHASMHPTEGWVMSVSQPAAKEEKG